MLITILLVVVLVLLLTGAIGRGRTVTAPYDPLSVLLWCIVALVILSLALRLTGLWVWTPAGW